MRIGYGYNRREEDFAHAECDDVYLDHTGTDRVERSRLLRGALRGEDTLVLLSRGDLGAGGELPQIRKSIAEMSVMVEVCPMPKPPTRAPGPPARFSPNLEQHTEIALFWHDLRYSGPYAVKRATEIMGFSVTRNMLNHNMGTRSEPKPFRGSENEEG